jgi:hypothetical protein
MLIVKRTDSDNGKETGDARLSLSGHVAGYDAAGSRPQRMRCGATRDGDGDGDGDGPGAIVLDAGKAAHWLHR